MRRTTQHEDSGTSPVDRRALGVRSVGAMLVAVSVVTASCGTDDSTADRQRPAAERSSKAGQSSTGSRRPPPAAPVTAAPEPDTVVPEPEAVAPAPSEPNVEPPVAPAASAPPADTSLTPQDLRKQTTELADRLLREFADDVDAVGLAGMIHDRNGQSTDAMRCWQLCLALDPNRADVLDAMAYVALKKGEYDRAVALWQQVLQAAPQASGIYHRLARALMGLGNMQEAAAALEKGLQLAPDASGSHLLLGQVRLQLEDYEKAKTSYRAALEIDADATDAYYGLATACDRLGETQFAARYRAQFKKERAEYLDHVTDQRSRSTDLNAMRPTAAQTYAEAGRIYARRGFMRTAEGFWRKGADLDPENIDARKALAAFYQQQNRNREALRVCEQLSDLQPTSLTAHHAVGILNARLGRHAAAEEAFKKIIELAPESPHGYRTLGGLYLSLPEKHAKAKQLTAKAVELEPTARNYFLLSVACEKTGDTAGALAAIRNAAELEPGNNQYRRRREQLQEPQHREKK